VRDDARAVNEGLTRLGPFVLLEKLGMRHRREGRDAIVLCPFHGEKTPSARLRLGAGGTLQLRCHGACQRSWDALALVAHARGLDLETDFQAVLIEGAGLAGLFQLEAELCELEGRERPPPRPPAPPPPPLERSLEPPREYAPRAEVDALWAAALPLVSYRPTGSPGGPGVDVVPADLEVYDLLQKRCICPELVADRDVARVLAVGAPLPRWARYRGPRPASLPWPELGYRLVLPVYDHHGLMRGVRAWRVGGDADDPKRLPPAGCRADGLVLACPVGRAMLATGRPPEGWPGGQTFRVLVAEGEPDYLMWATYWTDACAHPPAVLGLPGSGAWSADLAARIPSGAEVFVRTDPDDAGDTYAEHINALIGRRCVVRRPRREARA
jgi:hypothetical protein